MADPHGLIIGEIDAQAARDLLRAPALHPSPVTAMRLVLAVPLRARRSRHPTIDRRHHTGKTLLDIVAKALVRDQLRRLRTPSSSLRMPLRDRRLVVELIRTRRRVPPQLTRDRRRTPTEPASDCPHTQTLSLVERDLFALGE
jgi:hypothetical protein